MVSASGILLLFVSAAVTAAALVGFLRSRPPRPRRAIVAQYEPPRAVSVLLGGVLTGDRRRSTSAQLVDLAVRGFIAIHAPGHKDAGYVVQLLRADGLDDAELAAVRGLFGADAPLGAVAHLGRADPGVVRRLRWAQFRAESLAVSGGLQRGVASWRGGASGATLTVFGILVVFGWQDLRYALVALVFTVASFVLGSRRRRPLTPAGADVRDHLAGLRLYISVAEAHRLRALQSPSGTTTDAEFVHLTERLLGWAVLFGLEREWERALRLRGTGSGAGSGIGSGTDVGTADLAVLMAFASDFDGVAPDGASGGDPSDPATPTGSADGGDGGGSGSGDGGGDSGGGGGDGGGGGGGD